MADCRDKCFPPRRIFPSDCGGCTDELSLWDSIASEQARLAGVRLRYWRLRTAKNRDPLYKEPSNEGQEWEFDGPWEMYGSLEFEQVNQISTEATENGMIQTSEAVLWLARKEIEDAEAPYPKKGDVVEFWDEAPFAEAAQKTYWDVTGCERDGNIFNTVAYVQHRLELRRREKFFAIRKVEHTRI
jgi:hypothetical protein